MKNEKLIFWSFVFIHGLLWVAAPLFLRYALAHDTIEGVLWGQHLEWGYDKNPWMNAWLTRLGQEICSASGLGIYLMSSLFVIISFWSVWQLSRKIFPPVLALICVLLLEGCLNYTLVPQGFNDNVIELGLWPFMFWSFYEALQSQKIRYWILTGLLAGLNLMTKYYSGIPLLTMFLFLLLEPTARKSFKSQGLYWGTLTLVLVVFPHVLWLFQHDFITLKYAFNRAGVLPHQHSNALHFAIAQLLDFILPMVMLLVLVWMNKNQKHTKNIEITAENKWARKYIITMAIAPFLITIVLAFIFQWHLYTEWGVPLVALWSVILVLCFESKCQNVSNKIFYRFLVGIYIIMFLWVLGYAGGLYWDHKNKHSDNYPAQEIADYATNTWNQKYHKPLKYVAGSRYIGGYLVYYSKDHPSVFVEWDPQFSPWIVKKKMREYGALFVQDNYYGTTVFGEHPETNHGQQFPAEVLKQYPQLIVLPVKYFAWKRGNQNLPKIPVLIGFLPPSS